MIRHIQLQLSGQYVDYRKKIQKKIQEILYITAQLIITFLRQLQSLWETVQVPKSFVYEVWHCSLDSAECVSVAMAMPAASPKNWATFACLWQWLRHVRDWFSIVTGRDTHMRIGNFATPYWFHLLHRHHSGSFNIVLLVFFFVASCFWHVIYHSNFYFYLFSIEHFATPVKW